MQRGSAGGVRGFTTFDPNLRGPMVKASVAPITGAMTVAIVDALEMLVSRLFLPCLISRIVYKSATSKLKNRAATILTT